MKIYLFLFLITSSLLTYAQDLEIITDNRMLVLDDEKLGEEAQQVHLKYSFNLEGAQEKSIAWKISGEEKKDWKVVHGGLNEKEVDIFFKKVGNYDVGVTIKYSITKNGTEEKASITDKQKKFITVTKNLNVLTNLYSDANNAKTGKWMKLIKKADILSVKPEFAKDPMPNAYLARGYWGMYLNSEEDSRVKDPYKEAIKACGKSIKLDYNGVFIYMKDHKFWLDGFQSMIMNDYIFLENIIYDSKEIPKFYTSTAKEDKEKVAASFSSIANGLGIYTKITKNPMVVSWFEAGMQFNNRGASSAIKTIDELTPSLLQIKNLNDFTKTDKKMLKHGIIFCSKALKDLGQAQKACEILVKANEWFGDEDNFRIFFTAEFKGCTQE